MRKPMTKHAHMAWRAGAVTVACFALIQSCLPDDEMGALPMRAAEPPTAPLAEPIPGFDQGIGLAAISSAVGDTDRVDVETQAGDRLELIGIIGRLPDDVEVLLRMAEGGSQAVKVGGSVGGYTLKSVAPNRAVFLKDGREILLTIPDP